MRSVGKKIPHRPHIELSHCFASFLAMDEHCAGLTNFAGDYVVRYHAACRSSH